MGTLALLLLQNMDTKMGVAGALIKMLGALLFVYVAIMILMIACL